MTFGIVYSYRIGYNNPQVTSMERRVAKVNISAAGGTAAKGSRTCKVTLPTSWMDTMGISAEMRELELSFDGKQIVLSRYLNGEEFAARKLEQRHDVRLFRFYSGDQLCTTIYADFTDETLTAQNHINAPVKTAFGQNVMPSWEDFQAFLEDRCIPRARAGLLEYLDVIGVGEYDPLLIIEKTAGRMAEDDQWLEMEIVK